MFKNIVFQGIKLPTIDFRTVKTKNLRNPLDRAPLMIFPTNGPLLQTSSVQHREYQYGLLGGKLEAFTSC